MDKQKAIAIAGTLFPNYPSVKAFHITYDGQAFVDKGFAESHARTLGKDNQEVTAVTRSEWIAADVLQTVKGKKVMAGEVKTALENGEGGVAAVESNKSSTNAGASEANKGSDKVPAKKVETPAKTAVESNEATTNAGASEANKGNDKAPAEKAETPAKTTARKATGKPAKPAKKAAAKA